MSIIQAIQEMFELCIGKGVRYNQALHIVQANTGVRTVDIDAAIVTAAEVMNDADAIRIINESE